MIFVAILLVSVLLVQYFLSCLQIKALMNEVKLLKPYGKVHMGIQKVLFSKGAVALVCHNDNRIIKIKIMHGSSVFCRFKDYNTDIFDIKELKLKLVSSRKITDRAVLNAIDNMEKTPV